MIAVLFSQLHRADQHMIRYSLALTSPRNSECHVRTGEFPGAERAFQLAELIASDLGVEDESKWLGWTVEVRNAQGRKVFAVPVAGGDLN